MTDEFIEVTITKQIATITLNRPTKRNALHGPMIAEIKKALKQLSTKNIRVLLLTGAGAHFCAGGDIDWMQQVVNKGEDENYRDAQALADLLYQLYSFPQPTIALVKGSAFGGGMGLVAACDIAFATNDANFCLPEVKIGLTPSMISPYVISALGERRAHYYFLTGESFNAEVAYRIGFIHEQVAEDMLLSRGMALSELLLKNGPESLIAAKQLLHHVAKEKLTTNLVQKTAEHLADRRTTQEAQEGLDAFSKKRLPKWREE